MLRQCSIRSNQPPVILMKIINYSTLIGFLLILFAFIYTFLIIYGEIGEKTKIQENALLAGLVEEHWDGTQRLTKLLGDLGKIKNKQSDLRNYIFDQFVQMRVEVYRQQFKLLPSFFNSNNSISGENIYGIIRAFRSSPVEAILLAVPISASSIESIAVALAFADYSKDQLYWSRDLIFLFIDNGSIEAADIWLSSYFGLKKEGIEIINGNELPAHGGTFIGAFGLDLNGDLFDNVELLYGMINGKLPNMDILDLGILLVERTGALPTINKITRSRNDFDFKRSANTFLNGIISLSFNELESFTCVFGRYGINAITLRANEENTNSGVNTIDLVDIVRIVEGGMRSLNNLLEKFHHSYLLYIIIHPHYFVPAALYMPLFGLIISPLFLPTLREWFLMGSSNKLTICTIIPTIRFIGFSHLLSFCFYILQILIYSNINLLFSTKKELIIYFNTFILPIFILILFLIFRIKLNLKSFHFALFLINLELLLFLGALSFVNFPLTLIFCIILLPIAFVGLNMPISSSLSTRILLFLFFNPISISFLIIYYRLCISIKLNKCWQIFNLNIIEIIKSHFIYSSWLFVLISGPIFSICLCLIQILFAIVVIDNSQIKENVDEKDENKRKIDQEKKND